MEVDRWPPPGGSRNSLVAESQSGLLGIGVRTFRRRRVIARTGLPKTTGGHARASAVRFSSVYNVEQLNVLWLVFWRSNESVCRSAIAENLRSIKRLDSVGLKSWMVISQAIGPFNSAQIAQTK